MRNLQVNFDLHDSEAKEFQFRPLAVRVAYTPWAYISVHVFNRLIGRGVIVRPHVCHEAFNALHPRNPVHCFQGDNPGGVT